MLGIEEVRIWTPLFVQFQNVMQPGLDLPYLEARKVFKAINAVKTCHARYRKGPWSELPRLSVSNTLTFDKLREVIFNAGQHVDNVNVAKALLETERWYWCELKAKRRISNKPPLKV